MPNNLNEKLLNIEQSYRWLESGDIKGETESTIVAAQDQAINTNYFKNKILKEEMVPNYSLGWDTAYGGKICVAILSHSW